MDQHLTESWVITDLGKAQHFLARYAMSNSGRFERVPMHDPRVVKDWAFKGDVYGRHDEAFFRLEAGIVSMGGREQPGWAQPLLRELGDPGVICLMTHLRPTDGLRLYLVCATSEPGNKGVLLGGTDTQLSALEDDKRGEIVTYDGRQVFQTTVLFRATLQASTSNLNMNGSRVPFAGLYRELLQADRVYGERRCEDGGRFNRKVNIYAAIDLNPEEYNAVNEQIVNPPTVTNKNGQDVPAFNTSGYVWVDQATFEGLIATECVNGFLPGVYELARRTVGRPAAPLGKTPVIPIT